MLITFTDIKDFDPKQTFECGQCFRWIAQLDGSYSGVADGRYANVSYDSNARLLSIEELGSLPGITESESAERAWWRRYLDLDRNYAEIKKSISATSPLMKAAVAYGDGIRILRQDPWETVISFIISQNNHIPRIRGCIETLCREFGEMIEPSGSEGSPGVYAFPGIERLAELSEAKLGVCRLGYRAAYIAKATKQIAADGGRALSDAEGKTAEEAEAWLTSLIGVGPKVAHCIMLYSFGDFDIFPIDTWMKKVMSSLAGIKENDVPAMHAYAKKAYGDHCGIAQQYLFYYARSGEMNLRDA
jgi:N-glycosylase/DNA lyase